MPGYPHLTRFERDQIAELKTQGLGPTAIGAAIGRDKSTVSRELRRNAHQDFNEAQTYLNCLAAASASAQAEGRLVLDAYQEMFQ